MKGSIRMALAVALLTATAGSVRAQECGGEKSPCRVSSGLYYAQAPATPPAPGEKRKAVVYFHGAGGLGTNVLGEGTGFGPFLKAGYVVIGAQGLMRDNQAFGTGWSFRPEGPQNRDELAYAREVLTDAEARFGIDRARVLATGFSIGASLVWYLACKEPGLAAGYAPLAGGFWRPHPQDCAGPIDLLHTHGWQDRTVPLEGRPLRGGTIQQGDIFEGLALWRRVNGCAGIRPDAFDTGGMFWLRRWSECASGRTITLAVHGGEHVDANAPWADLALAWFEARLKARGGEK